MTGLDALACAVPVAVVAFAALTRSANRAGARRLPAGWSAFALAAAGAWCLASRLGGDGTVPGLDTALAGALTLLLLTHAAVQWLALRPLLGRRSPRRPPWPFLALALIVYATLLPWTTSARPPDGDEPYYLLLTHSLVQDADGNLADDYAAGEGRRFLDRPLEPQPGDPTGPRGEIYSRHNLFLPLLLALPYALAGKAGALAAMAFLAALLVWRTLGLARRAYPERRGGALLACGSMALASPLLLYSGQVWVEVPAALALVVALECLDELTERLRQRSRPGLAAPWVAGLGFALSVSALPLLKLRFALVAIPLVVLALWRLRGGLDPRAARVLSGVALVAGVGVLAYNQIVYGNALKMHSWRELDLAQFGPARYLRGLLGLGFDAAFGLFGATPLWLLTLPAAVLAVIRKDRYLALLMMLAAPYLLFAVPRDEWYGGWSPPFRYGMVFLPLLAVLLVPLWADRRRSLPARALTLALGVTTLALLALFVAVPGWAYNLADGRTHLTDLAGMATGLDFARFFPSYVRPRTATWIWPPVALALTTWAFLGARRRLGHGDSAATLGAVGLLLAAATLPLAAARWPTRTVELEDPWIDHRGGHLYPEKWTVSRVDYRGGWVLRPGEALAVPIVAGGPELALEIDLKFVRNNPDPLTLELLSGNDVRFRWVAEGPDQWRHLVVPPLPWSTDKALVVRAVGPSRGGPQNGILFDRMELGWP